MTIRILDQLFWVCSSILIATVNFLLIYYGAKNELNLFCIWILGISCYIGLTLVSFFSRYKYIYNQFRKILQKKGRINKSVSIKATFNMFIVVLLLALFIYLVFSSGLLVFFINPVGKSEIFLLTVRVVGGICFFIFTFPIVILFEIFYIYLLRLLIVYKNWYCKGILDTFCWKVQNTLLFFPAKFRSASLGVNIPSHLVRAHKKNLPNRLSLRADPPASVNLIYDSEILICNHIYSCYFILIDRIWCIVTSYWLSIY